MSPEALATLILMAAGGCFVLAIFILTIVAGLAIWNSLNT